MFYWDPLRVRTANVLPPVIFSHTFSAREGTAHKARSYSLFSFVLTSSAGLSLAFNGDMTV